MAAWDEKHNEGMPAGTDDGGSAVVVILVVVVVGFFGIMVLGILAAIAIPAYQGYTVRARIQEGVNLANDSRNSLALACAGGRLQSGQTNNDLGIAQASDFETTTVRRIDALVIDESTARVIITYNALGDQVEDGSTITYSGTCDADGMSWKISGTIPEKFWPKR